MKIKMNGSVKILILLCWLTYFANCVSRYNMSACMPQMLAENAFSTNELAQITSGFFLCYAFGQVINGFIGDKLNPYWMISIGMVGSALCNLLIFFFSGYQPVRIFWTINGVFQSLVWPPMVRIVAKLCNESERMSFATALATTVPCGTVFVYGISILMIKFFTWQTVFLVSAISVSIIAAIWILNIFRTARKIKSDKDDGVQCAEIEKANVGSKPASLKVIFKAFLASGAIIGFLPVIFHGAIMEGLATWLPTVVTSTGILPIEYSLVLTMGITLINVFGAFIATLINRKFKNEFLTTAVIFTFTLISMVVAFIFVGNGIMLISMLMLSSLSMSAVNTMLASLVPMKFSNLNRTSMIAGITNGIIYGGGSLFGFFTGMIIESFSWQGVIVLWGTVALVAAVISYLVTKKWGSYHNKSYLKTEVEGEKDIELAQK